MNKAQTDKSKVTKKLKPLQADSAPLKKQKVKKAKPSQKSLKDMLNELPAERQAKIKLRAKELIAQEMTLSDLRRALKLTQEELAKVLHIKQEAVSRLERRSDLLLSTLGSYIESMGGKLKLTAEFPNRPPVNLTGFNDIDQRAH